MNKDKGIHKILGQPKGSNKVEKWKSCHQEREIEHFGVTMAKPLWSYALGIGRY
jgi:hypothetical protein